MAQTPEHQIRQGASGSLPLQRVVPVESAGRIQPEGYSACLKAGQAEKESFRGEQGNEVCFPQWGTCT